MLKKIRSKKAITLISLVVTIIVLIVLAGISVNLILGENGLIERTMAAKEKATLAQEEEEHRLNELYSSIMVATGEGSEITISMQDLNTLIDSKVDDKLSKIKTETVPAGTVISYMGNNAPEGYLFCNGATYNISDYPDLAEQIKTEFGSYNYYGGDGTATFAVPNLQGEFLRGTGTNSYTNQGNGTAVGKHQDGTVIPHIMQGGADPTRIILNVTNTSGTYQNIARNLDKNQATRTEILQFKMDAQSSMPDTDTVAAYYTTRPTNTSVLYCIKY